MIFILSCLVKGLFKTSWNFYVAGTEHIQEISKDVQEENILPWPWKNKGASSSLEISDNTILSRKDFESIQLDWAKFGGRL